MAGTRKKDFFRSMRSMKKTIFAAKNKTAARLWMETKEIITTTHYCNTRYAWEIADLVIEGYPDEAISVKLGITENTLRVHMRNCSKSLYTIFGEDFFDLFGNGLSVDATTISDRINLARISLMEGKDLVTALFPIELVIGADDVVKGVSEDAMLVAGLNLDDCAKELRFLERHSLSTLNAEMLSLDPTKLAYIMSILTNDEVGDAELRCSVLEKIGGLSKK